MVGYNARNTKGCGRGQNPTPEDKAPKKESKIFGEVKWTYQSEGISFGRSIAIDDESVYLGSSPLQKLDKKTGKLIWKTEKKFEPPVLQH